LQLMQWGAETGLDEAMAEIFSPGFDPATASMENASVRKVLYFGETVGALVKHDLIDLGLLRDVLWFDGMWTQVGPHALAAREQANEPTLYENFEALISMPKS
jgi:hypothetical protein